MSDIPLGSLTYPQLLDAAMTLRAELDKTRLSVQRLDSENTQYCGKLADCKRELERAQRERDELKNLLKSVFYAFNFSQYDNGYRLSKLMSGSVTGKEVIDELAQLTLAREELAALIELASDFLDYDKENETPICTCCHMELDDQNEGHRANCLAWKILTLATTQSTKEAK